MFKSLISTAGAVAVAAATLLLSADNSWARSRPGGGGGGSSRGSSGYRGGNYGGYRGGYYGGYRGGYYGGYGWGYPGYYGGYYSPRVYRDGYYGSVDGPSYYTVPSTESVMPAAEESEAVVEQVAKIDVIVPSSTATILIDGKPTTQKGTLRKFETPDLTSGRSFSSEFTVRWTENGQQREQSRTVSYRAGQHLTVDFTRSQTEKIPAPRE